MHPTNINRLLLFAKDGDNVMSFDEMQQQYGILPDGCNFYYGISDAAVQNLNDTGAALNETHTAFFQRTVDALNNGNQPRLTVILGVEPAQPGGAQAAFDFVDNNLGLVGQLKTELAAYQARTGPRKTLDIIIRFASEMNDPSNGTYGSNPARYVQSFRNVKGVMSQAPSFPMTFSPALRRDLAASAGNLSAYWPGDQFVDRISCTWYVARDGDMNAAVDLMRGYYLHRVDKGLPFGIDELGGADGDADNDLVLKEMFDALGTLGAQEVTFDWVTVFLQGKWRTDATLAFLR